MEKPHKEERSQAWLEHRASVRYEFSIRVEIDWRGWKVWGRVRNLSRTGLLIEVPPGMPIPEGPFQARLALHRPLPVECVVRRIAPGNGIGVSIEIPDEIAELRYAALLVALSMEAPGDRAGTEEVASELQPAVAESSGR
jgi:PilZ domain-containing protein